MAIIVYSALVSSIKGRIGGSVFQKLGNSLGIRAYSTFKPSNSQLAQTKRFQANLAAQKWRELTPTQILSWQTVAPGYPATNRYGVAIVLSAYQLFFRINKRQLAFGLSQISSPSAYSVQPSQSVTLSGYNQGTSTFNLTYAVAQTMYDNLLLYLSPVVLKGSTLKNVKLKAWIVRSSGAVTTYNLWSLLPDEYKTFDVTRYGFEVIAMNVNGLNGVYNSKFGMFSNI